MTNESQGNYKHRETPVWRILLSVGIAIFAVGRLAYTCSRQNTAKDQNVELQQMLQETQSQYQEAARLRQAETERISNRIMYIPYDSLEKMEESQRNVYKIMKVEKDSMLRLDISTKIKIAQNSYFQKNFDDSLKMAIKTPENLTMFIHDFSGEGNIKENFISLKKYKNPVDVKEESVSSTKILSYTITQEGKKFNGYALCFQNGGYFCFIEFESDKLKKADLKLKALTYLISNLEKTK